MFGWGGGGHPENLEKYREFCLENIEKYREFRKFSENVSSDFVTVLKNDF